MQDKLILSGVEFHGYCGITPEEREAGQRIVVDLEIDYDNRQAAQSDDLRDAVDYAAVANRLAEIGRSEKFHLIEALAERLAQSLIKEFGVKGLRLRVKKLHPPVEAIRNYAGIEIFRKA